MALRRLVLVRHGETDGNSAARLIGSGDPSLSTHGRAQVRAVASALHGAVVDLVVSSPARRAFQSAQLLVGDAPIRLEPLFREIHFGRWEGRSLPEIEAADPSLYAQWRELAPDFEYPGGEPRAAFRARVQRGLEQLLETPASGALVVAHKGVIRTIVETLTSETLEREQPALGAVVSVTRAAGGAWCLGSRSSNPPGVAAAVPQSAAPPAA